MPLKIFVMGAASELGYVTIQQLLARGHTVSGQVQSNKGVTALRAFGAKAVIADPILDREIKAALETFQPDVVLNLTPQVANTLLHDGQDWQNYAYFLPATSLALLNALEAVPVKFLVQASYAFLYGNAELATEASPVTALANDPIFQAAVEAERMIITNQPSASIVRLGYLYGPQSRSLVQYIRSFEWLRPYYAGSENHRASFLHFEDAANGLALLAEKQPAGEIFNLVDNEPSSFGNFMDYFAQRSGFAHPAHIPVAFAPAVQFFIKAQQLELLTLRTSVSNTKACKQLGWALRYPDYRQGLTQTVQSWRLRRRYATAPVRF